MAIERYHGSTARALAYSLFKPISRSLRKFGLAVTRGAEDPTLRNLLDRAGAFAIRDQQAAALVCVRQAADIAEKSTRSNWEIGAALACLGDLRRGLRLMAPTVSSIEGATDWKGEDLADRTLFIRQRTKSDMGGAVRLARFVAHGEQRAARCVVLVEPRLVPLFRRSFPKSEVRSMDERVVAPAGSYATSLEALAADVVTDWASVPATFVPLRADPAVTAELRKKYSSASGGQPVVGITWGSRNSRKDSPRLAEWADLVRSVPATFVSLQYGPVSAALRKLRGGVATKLIEDESVDQMQDMDRFAAQVASLDAVIASSNTASHLAGALGVPMVLVRDNRFGTTPLSGTDTGWYPRAVQVRRGERSWEAALSESATRLPASWRGRIEWYSASTGHTGSTG